MLVLCPNGTLEEGAWSLHQPEFFRVWGRGGIDWEFEIDRHS